MKRVNRWCLRVLVVVANSMGHPLLVSFLLRESRSTCQAENDGEKHQSVQCPRNDEAEPHAEVVYLGDDHVSLITPQVEALVSHLQELGAGQCEDTHAN